MSGVEAAAQHLDLWAAEVDSTVICKGMAVKKHKPGKMSKGWASRYLSLVDWAIHLSGMQGWGIQVGSTPESSGDDFCNSGRKSYLCWREVGAYLEVQGEIVVFQGQVGHRDLKQWVWCVVRRAPVNVWEILIQLIIVCVRGLLQAATGINEEPEE